MLVKYLMSLGINNDAINNILYALENNGHGEKKNIQIIEKKVKIFDWIGINDEDITEILESNIAFFSVDIKTMLYKLGNLYIFGYYPEEIADLVKENPTILSSRLDFSKEVFSIEEKNKEVFSVEDYESLGFNKHQYQKIKNNSQTNCDFDSIDIYMRVGYLYTLGYMPWEVVKMASSCSRVVTSPSTTIQKKYNALIDMGFSQEGIHKITVSHAKIFSYNSITINNRIENLIGIGLTRDEAIHAIEIYPQILSLTWEHCLERKQLFEDNGFTSGEVLIIIKKFPTIFGWSIDKCIEKLSFIAKYDLKNVMLEDACHLIISNELLESRINYFDEIGIDYKNGTNFRRLFRTNKEFQDSFKITKEELLEKYSSSSDRTLKIVAE